MQEECGTLALCDICCSCFLFPWGARCVGGEEALFIGGPDADGGDGRKEGGEVASGERP